MFTLPRNPRFYRPRYILEAIPVFLFYGLCAALPLDAASGFGGWLARTIGPLMGISRRAEHNLRRAMPELDATARKKIIRGMWDNLGRVVAEYPHLSNLIAKNRIAIVGQEWLVDMAQQGRGGLIISGHLANWETGPVTSAHFGAPMAVIYRAPNNPYVDWLIKRARLKVSAGAVPKGTDGAIRLMRHLRNKGCVGILIDQKLNEGIDVPFFGIKARTTPAPAELGIRFGCPMVLARCIRRQGAYFSIEIRPVVLPHTDSRIADVAALTHTLTAQLESWIREYPEQWLWLHNRWPKE
ncbi:MAG: lauroyl acyltransferase [Alphaproteobacteria bacterium]